MGKSYKVQLNIRSKKVLEVLKKMSGIYRAVYNLGIEAQFYKMTHSCKYLNTYDHYWINGTDLRKVLETCKKPFINEVDGGVFNAAVFASSKAFTGAFRFSLPKFYSRKKTGLKFKTLGKVKVFYDYITIPKLGKVKLCERGRIPQGAKYSNITFSNDGKNWFISVEVKDQDAKKELLTGAPVYADIDFDGNLNVNGKLYENIINSGNYKKAEARLKRLHKKLVRQATANKVRSKNTHMVTRKSRNIIKTEKAMNVIKIKMNNIKKDYFKKVSNEVARTKPTQLHIPSNVVLLNERQGLLARKLRKSGSKQFLSILRKKLSFLGSEVVRHSDYSAFKKALSSRVIACGGSY